MDTPENKEEAFLNQFVDNYMNKLQQTGQDQGKSSLDLDETMMIGSFKLSFHMMRKKYTGTLPKGPHLVEAFAECLESSKEEAQEVLQGFIQVGWLKSDHELSEKGKKLLLPSASNPLNN